MVQGDRTTTQIWTLSPPKKELEVLKQNTPPRR
jgi:hypothetical protein